MTAKNVGKKARSPWAAVGTLKVIGHQTADESKVRWSTKIGQLENEAKVYKRFLTKKAQAELAVREQRDELLQRFREQMK